MKRKLLAVVMAVTLTTGVSFQSAAQVEQGSIIIDPVIGAPTGNIWWKAFEDETGFKAVGPPIGFGGRFEYMVADNFGLGLDVNYVMTGYEYTSVGTGAYDSTSMTYADETVGYRANKLRIMLRFNYHFVQTENFDAYIGAGAGYKHVKRQAYLNGEVDDDYTITGAFIPVAVRAALGVRYYFLPFMGINAEIGIGGGQILQGGLSFKF